MGIVTMYQSVSRTAVRLPGDGRRTAAATAAKAARTNLAAATCVGDLLSLLNSPVPLSSNLIFLNIYLNSFSHAPITDSHSAVEYKY